MAPSPDDKSGGAGAASIPAAGSADATSPLGSLPFRGESMTRPAWARRSGTGAAANTCSPAQADRGVARLEAGGRARSGTGSAGVEARVEPEWQERGLPPPGPIGAVSPGAPAQRRPKSWAFGLGASPKASTGVAFSVPAVAPSRSAPHPSWAQAKCLPFPCACRAFGENGPNRWRRIAHATAARTVPQSKPLMKSTNEMPVAGIFSSSSGAALKTSAAVGTAVVGAANKGDGSPKRQHSPPKRARPPLTARAATV
mmetsp:Transcript_45628/g.97481  ORF Transcript_45628/g.97481 Transcript_45628/m.97481 type:complete len:256 (+) Transcript_45628:167-934(+)